MRVVLLRDRARAAAPGWCCLRHHLLRTLAAMGATVHTTWDWRLPTAWREADLVVAESLATVRRAARAGTPRHALWALALPPERLVPDDPGGYAADLASVAPLVHGFITDDVPAQESIERALSRTRVQVEVMPGGDGPPCACGDAGGRQREEAPPTTPWGPRPGADPTPPEPGGPVLPASRQRDRTARRLLEPATATGGGAPTSRAESRSVLVAGFDLKFATGLAERLAARRDFHVTVDEWPRLDRGTSRSKRLARRSGAILAEWVRPSAVWLARRKRAGQFLAVRLHRYELDAPYPHHLDIDKVDAVVHIAPLIGARIRAELAWPADKLVYIPNYLDLDWLDRPKLPAARFAIGLVGIDVARKRFDLALDLLARLRREDPRFTLVVRSVLPWHNPYTWAKPDERAFAAQCFERLERDPLLRDGVIFDPPGRDMARWFRRVGVILSGSDTEGSHAALAEGMASGAVPVLRPWPGAGDLYGREWIRESTEAAAQAVADCVDQDLWRQRSERARAEVHRTHDPVAVVAAWADLLHGDVAGARAHFAHHLTAPAAPVATGHGQGHQGARQ